jgi:hypothetical protein
MRAFFAQVGSAVPAKDDVLLVGDGEVVDHFAGHMKAHDRDGGVDRRIAVEKSGPMTEPQLLARIRVFAGMPPRRTLPS